MEACLFFFFIKVIVFGLLYLDEGVLQKIKKVTRFLCYKIKTKTYIQNLRHYFLDKNVFLI